MFSDVRPTPKKFKISTRLAAATESTSAAPLKFVIDVVPDPATIVYVVMVVSSIKTPIYFLKFFEWHAAV